MAAPYPSGSAAPDAPPLSTLRVAAVVYTLFVVYGCLVPLDFRPVPWADAWAKFRQIPEFRPGRWFRNDFIANVLLFVPLGFLWAGSVGAGWRRAGAVAKTVLVWAAAVLFQAALEFGQIYLPPRSVSFWDVVAAGWGAAVGLAAWGVFGGPVGRALDRWVATHDRRGIAGWLVLPYTIFLVLFNIVPGDMTLNMASLHAKWDRGFIRPFPFASLGDDPAVAAFGLAAQALLWLPLAALLVLGGRARPFAAWSLTFLFALGIEALQVTVQSRLSDSTDIFCAAAGAAVGVLLAVRIRRLESDGLPS